MVTPFYWNVKNLQLHEKRNVYMLLISILGEYSTSKATNVKVRSSVKYECRCVVTPQVSNTKNTQKLL